jgi:F-type H+-transporting ATPase subunit delta
MSGIRIASRYAKSLLILCNERGQLDLAQADMKLLESAMDENRDLRVMLSSPVIKADKKVEILNLIFKDKLSEITMGFITLLTKKGREGLLHEVAESFNLQVNLFKGIAEALVTSAVPLDASSREKIMASAIKLAGSKVELREKVDSDLIGGFILKVGDNQIDTSLASRIKLLRREFADNPYIPEI